MRNAHDRGATEPFKILHTWFPFPPSICDSPPPQKTPRLTLHPHHLHILLFDLHRSWPRPPSLPADTVSVASIHTSAHRNAIVDSKVLFPLHIYHFVFEGRDVQGQCSPRWGLTLDLPSCNGRCGLYRLAGRDAKVPILPVVRVFAIAWYATRITRVLSQTSFTRCGRLGLGEGSLELVFGEVEVFQGFVQAALVEVGVWW
ncbi:hypothetical protein HOY82DRAFT_491171 [Tuber indicum]|nr:hypothetical protein HOY82DRAFT_491171 [Tuber indicum]